MKKWVFVFLLLLPLATAMEDHPSVEELLLTQDEVKVIVVLKDQAPLDEELDMEEMKVEHQEAQKEVLDELVLKPEGSEGMGEEKGEEPIGIAAVSITAEHTEEPQEAQEEYDLDLDHQYTIINGFSGSVTKEGYEKLKDHPDVESISVSVPVHIHLDESKVYFNGTNTWRLIYNGTNLTGRGQSVCVIDTGVDYTHPMLGNCTKTKFLNGQCNKVISGYNYCVNDACTISGDNASDNHGHGTHVAGTIASTNDTYRGIAPDATIIAIKALNSSGTGDTAGILAGMDWCISNATKFNITVISMSLGTTSVASTACDSISPYDLYANLTGVANRQNISVVASSGNSGFSTGISAPACVANITSVGATSATDAIKSFTNRNILLDLLAPGDNIDAPVPTGGCSLCDSDGIRRLDGTSMAAPHVSASFVLLRQYFRVALDQDPTHDTLEDILNDTGRPITSNGFDTSRVNPYDAILSQDSLAPEIMLQGNTPANGTVVNITLKVNISVNELLRNVSLEVNGTNVSMNGSGLNYIADVDLGGDVSVMSFRIHAQDYALNARATGFYNITVTSQNFLPMISGLQITSTDELFRTNGTLSANFTVSDVNGDPLVNETRWYNDSEEVTSLRNATTVYFGNTTKLENWTVSVRAHDGQNYSAFVNTSVVIANALPELNITPLIVSISETQLVNISVNATDIDGDSITFSTNRSSDFVISGGLARWETDLDDAGYYVVNISANDSSATTSTFVNITLMDARDVDSDGNPDFNDTDDDNDGLADTIDFIVGMVGSINATTNLSVNLTINGTSEFTGVFNGTFEVIFRSNLSNSSQRLFAFNFTFNDTSRIDLNNITLNYTVTGTSALSIRGIDLVNHTKTAFLDKVNTTARAVCIKDEDASYVSITSTCSGSSETLVECDNTTESGYTCYDLGTRYKVTGLNNSAIKELCVDVDGDGYGEGCTLGSDCNDNNAGQTTSCSSGSSSSSGGGGGGGGGSGGSGGGAASTASTSGSYSIFYSSIEANELLELNINRDALAVKELNILPSRTLESTTIRVLPLEEDTAAHEYEGEVYQYFDASVSNAQDSDIRSAEIIFRVPGSWYNTNGLDPDSTILVHYDGGWDPLETHQIDSSADWFEFSATSRGFSLFAITASAAEPSTEPITEIEEPSGVQEDSVAFDTAQGEEINVEEFAEPDTMILFSSFSLVSLLIVIIVLSLTGFAGYRYYEKKHKNDFASQLEFASKYDREDHEKLLDSLGAPTHKKHKRHAPHHRKKRRFKNKKK